MQSHSDKVREAAWVSMLERDAHDRDRRNWRVVAGVSGVAGFLLGMIVSKNLPRKEGE
jgi:hypothetical protein